MRNGAIGRSVVVIVAGLLTFYATPSKACESAACQKIVLAQNDDATAQTESTPATPSTTPKVTKRKARHAQASNRRKTAGLKSGDGKKKTAQAVTSTESDQDKQDAVKPDVSPSVANANARMSATADISDNADGSAAPSQVSGGDTNQTTQSGLPIVGSDELNDLDRAAAEDKPAPQTPRPVSLTYQVANAARNDAWSQSSLVGKIFIAFGGLLTLASAARMFMA